MQKAEELLRELASDGSAPALIDALPRYVESAPDWLVVDADVWNIAPLLRSNSARIFNISFGAISNLQVRELARLYALWQIVDQKVGAGSIRAAWQSFVVLGQTLEERSVETLKTEDFYTTDALLRGRFNAGSAARACSDLAAVGRWLSRHVGMRIDYVPKDQTKAKHGRTATDEERQDKLLPDEIIASLLAARGREDLNMRDRFFLSAIGIEVATGFRLNELLTLPEDCLIEDTGALLVRNFTSKGGKHAPRAVPDELADMVRDAVLKIRNATEPARQRAKKIYDDPPLDWLSILVSDDQNAINYFVRRWLAAWIDRPINRLIDPRNAFLMPRGQRPRWIPIMDLIEKHNGNVSAISRELGVARLTVDFLIEQVKASQRGEVYTGSRMTSSQRGFDTDIRFPSARALASCIGLKLIRGKNAELVTTLVNEARKAMLAQATFAMPEKDNELEAAYLAQREVLRDPTTGNTVLNHHEALFVTFRNQLSPYHATDENIVTPVTTKSFNHWLAGYERDRGTGKPGDAICARLGIVDPRTGEIASFTNHDFRHWLATSYENGGLSQLQISTLFNRVSITANSVYSQTSAKIRRERLRDAMSDGLVIGHVAEAYLRIAKETPEEATEFLKTATMFYNPMPHGICRMNWAMEPCPHALSCFSCSSEPESEPVPCEHLIVDPEDASQLAEIERINRNAKAIMKVMEEEGAVSSPQYEKQDLIQRSTKQFLETAKRK